MEDDDDDDYDNKFTLYHLLPSKLKFYSVCVCVCVCVCVRSVQQCTWKMVIRILDTCWIDNVPALLMSPVTATSSTSHIMQLIAASCVMCLLHPDSATHGRPSVWCCI